MALQTQQLDVLKLISEELTSINNKFNSQLSLLDSLDVYTEKIIRNFEKITDVNNKQYVTLQNILNINRKQGIQQSKILAEEKKHTDVLTETKEVDEKILVVLEKITEEQQKSREEAEERLRTEKQESKEKEKQVEIDEEAAKVKANLKEKEKIHANFIKQLGKDIFNLAKNTTLQWSKNSEKFREVGAIMGKTENQIQSYQSAMYGVSIDTLKMYNVGHETLLKWQTDYINHSGKVLELTKQTQVELAGLSNIIGESGVQELINNLEDFGQSATSAMKFAKGASDIATKNGISVSKTISEVNKNLALIDKYGFKEGIKGLQRMVGESIKFKVNMNEIGKLADKINSPEGAIETAAQLQILGGSYAKIADPLSMLYEGLNDFEGLSKRVIDSTAGSMRLMSNGVVEYKNSYERMRAQAAASAMGMSFDDYSKIARTSFTRQAIQGDVNRNKNINNESSDLIASRAARGVSTSGQEGWVVSVQDEKGQTVSKLVSELNANDEEYLKKMSEPVNSIAENVMGIYKRIVGGYNAAEMGREKTLQDTFGDIAKPFGDYLGGVMSYTPWITGLLSNTSATWANTAALLLANKGGMKAVNKNIASNLAGGGLKGGLTKLTRATPLIGGLIAGGSTAYDQYQQGNFSEESGKQGRAIGSTAGSTAGGVGGALAGAKFGSMFGTIFGPIGTAIGGLLGAAVGGISGSFLGERFGGNIGSKFDRKIEGGIISKEGDITHYDDNDEIFAAKKGSNLNNTIRNSIEKDITGQIASNNIDTNSVGTVDFGNDYERMRAQAAASAMGISSKNTLSQVLPERNVLKSELDEYHNKSRVQSYNNNVNISPLNIVLSGSIELKSNGNSTTIDADKLLYDPIFMKNLANKIQQQINMDTNGGRSQGWAGRYNLQ